jgi:hypothetical protein
MAIYKSAFGLVLFLYVISALPLEGQQNEQQIDLFKVDSNPQSDVQVEAVGSDDLTRNKRHGGYGGYGKWLWLKLLKPIN